MNAKLRILLALQLTCSTLSAQAVADTSEEPTDKIRYKLILPDEKTPEVVKPNEPNPFNKGDGVVLKSDDSNSEENRVKDRLLAMRPSGIVHDPADGSVRRVMLGEIPLERGMIVPAVLTDQQVCLRVNSLSDTSIELFWVEKKKHAGVPPRPVIIPVSMEPLIRSLLPVPSASDVLHSKGGEKGSNSMWRQTSPLIAAPTNLNQMPTRRAELIDDSAPGKLSEGTPVKAADAPALAKKADPNHPLNLLMNLFSNKSENTQQPAPEK